MNRANAQQHGRRRKDAAPKTSAPRTAPTAPSAKAGAVRTCVACRGAGGRDELARLVEGPDGAIAVDPRARADGRGAWVHPTRKCLTLAAKRHAAERSLKVPTRELDAEALVSQVQASLRRKADSLLQVARRKDALVIGAAATAEALERTRVPLVLLADDAGETAKALAEERSDGASAPGFAVRRYGSKAELGAVVGRSEVAILALSDAGIAVELLATMDRIAGVEG